MTSSSFDPPPSPNSPCLAGGGAALGRGLTQAQLQGPEEGEVVRRKTSLGHRRPWRWKWLREVKDSPPGFLSVFSVGKVPTRGA